MQEADWGNSKWRSILFMLSISSLARTEPGAIIIPTNLGCHLNSPLWASWQPDGDLSNRNQVVLMWLTVCSNNLLLLYLPAALHIGDKR